MFIVFISIGFYACSKETLPSENNSVTSTEAQVEFIRDFELENQFLLILNEYLSSNGFNQLERISEADLVAVIHTQNLMEVNTLHHTNFSERQNYFFNLGYTALRENVALGYSNPETLLNAWLHSPSHKSAIESNSNKTGLGILISNTGKHFITQLYLK